MNTYAKYCPNVFLAKCEEQYQKGDIILVTTKYGKKNECEVHNLILVKDGFYYYSITRTDGFNSQERAKRKAERLESAANRAENISNQYYEASNEGKEFLSLGEPIKVGHHSEKRHRALIERNWNRMAKSVEFSDKAKEYKERAEYWKALEGKIDLSMAESIEYFEYKLEESKERHEGLKSGRIARDHSFSLTYAKKEVNELSKKLEIAKKLWG